MITPRRRSGRSGSSSTASSRATETGAPTAWRNRAGGTIDEYAAAVGRWLVTRDGFDLLVYYLSDYDYASHALGPDAAHEALARSDAALGAIVDAAGGLDAFLERYALIVCSDHGQTPVREIASLAVRLAGEEGVLVTASNRAGQLYDLRGDATRARSRSCSTPSRRSRSRSSSRTAPPSPDARARSCASPPTRRRLGAGW